MIALAERNQEYQISVFARHPRLRQAMLLNFGHERIVDPVYRWNGLRRGPQELVILQVTLSGCGRLRFHGRNFRIGAGCGMLLAVPQDHEYWFEREDGHWEHMYATLYGAEVTHLLRPLIDEHGPLLQMPPDSPLLEMLRRIGRADHRNPYRASVLAYELTMLLMEKLWQRERGNESQREAIVTATAQIKRHLDRPLSVTRLARSAGLSRSHFTRLFTRIEGVSPAEFIASRRMELAVMLMQTEQLTVKQIASRCGYADPSHFCRVFRRHFGASPRAFQRGNA